MSTHCPGCGAELVVQLERTESDELRAVIRDELAMAMPAPAVIEVPVEVPVEAPVEDELEDAVEDAIEPTEDAIEELVDEVAELVEELGDDAAADEIEDALADELDALETEEPPAAPAVDDEPSRGHWLNRKVFG